MDQQKINNNLPIYKKSFRRKMGLNKRFDTSIIISYARFSNKYPPPPYRDVLHHQIHSCTIIVHTRKSSMLIVCSRLAPHAWFDDRSHGHSGVVPLNPTEGQVETTVLQLKVLLGQGTRLTEPVADAVLARAPFQHVLLPHLHPIHHRVEASASRHHRQEDVDCPVETTSCKMRWSRVLLLRRLVG